MAVSCIALMWVRASITLRSSKNLAINKDGGLIWVSRYRTKAGVIHKHRQSQPETVNRGRTDLLREFPQPKNLLHSTLSKSLRLSDVSQYIQYSCADGEVKRATVTLYWPMRLEAEGFGSCKIEAERYAAAAACYKLKELGILDGVKQPSIRGMVRHREGQKSVWEDHKEDVTSSVENLPIQKRTTSKALLGQRSIEEDPKIREALSMFSKPKALLSSVIQVATSSCRVRELLQYRMIGGQVKTCELTVRWPVVMTFSACGHRRLEAESKAAALACLRFKELRLLDEQNNPLTHARYHYKEVHEAGERERRPCYMEIPKDLEQRIQEYLAQYPAEAEVHKLWYEKEELAVQTSSSITPDDEFIIDAITSKPYRVLQPEEAENLSDHLLSLWMRAGPGRGVELPVDSYKERVLAAVESSQVVVIAGETGCGKTTRIPRFLLEGQVRSGMGATCNVLVTQPRRISAVSVAHRVAQEMGPALRHCVGYQVRLESRPPEQNGGALLFLTVGVLLRKLQSNPTLQGISHVVVDEVHERDVNTDLLLALLRSALKQNQDIRVVLMSATSDTQRLSQYFGGCPVVSVSGFMHPVQERYLEEVMTEMGQQIPAMGSEKRNRQEENDAVPNLDLVTDVIDSIHSCGEPGAVLCFLPGWQEIKAVQQKLEEKEAYKSGSQMILPLHSSMAVADQQAVFHRPPEGQRKIVLATNIAETSITIDDIVHVVDVGLKKEQNYDPKTKVSGLKTVWISRTNVIQRRGRAGRCQPGHAYHLFPRKHLDTMTMFPIPEILRIPLENVVIQAKIHCPDSKAVDFLSQVPDCPDCLTVKVAVNTLMDIGVLDNLENLTPLGKRVACMSCDPRLGKVLVLSALFGCVLPILSVAACLTRDPFYNSMQNRALLSKTKKALSGSSCSDYLVFSRVVQSWKDKQDKESKQEYVDKYTLSGASLRFIHGLMHQFSENLAEAGLVDHSAECLHLFSCLNQHSQQEQLLKAVLLAGLYPNLIQVKRGTVTKGGRFRPENISYRTQSGPVLLHRSSVNRGEQKLSSRWLTFFSAMKSNSQVFIRDSSVVHPLALLLLTDCDLSEKVVEDRVEVALPGHTLIRWQFCPHTWELLWDLRMSLQAMIHRNLQPSKHKSNCTANNRKDSQLIYLLVDLLNNTYLDSSNNHEDSQE